MNNHLLEIYDITCVEVAGEPYIPRAWGWSPNNRSEVPDCVALPRPDGESATVFCLHQVERAITNDGERITETEFDTDFEDFIAPFEDVQLPTPPTDRIHWIEFTADCECCREDAGHE